MDDPIAVGRVPRVLREPGQARSPRTGGATGARCRRRPRAPRRPCGRSRTGRGSGARCPCGPAAKPPTNAFCAWLTSTASVDSSSDTSIRCPRTSVRGSRVAREQPGQDRDRAEQPGHDVADRDAHLRRLSPVLVRRPRDRHQPADRLHDEVVAGLPRIRAVRAEAGDREVHEVRVERGERGVPEPEPGQPTDPVVLDQHVRRAEEAPQDLAPGVGLEVDTDRALVPVDGEEVGGGARARGSVTDPRRSPAPRRVAVGRLDLDHVRAEVGEQHRAVRPGEDRRAVGDPDPGERPEAGLELAATGRRVAAARQVCHRPMVARPPASARARRPWPYRSASRRSCARRSWPGMDVCRWLVGAAPRPTGGTGPPGPPATHRLLRAGQSKDHCHGDDLVRDLRVRRDRRALRRPRDPRRRGVARRLRAVQRAGA